VDGVFLDLPEPWLAVPQACKILKPNRRVVSYSPCIEQTMKTCTALRENGFHSIRTIETRLKTYDVLRTSFPVPDFGDGAPLTSSSPDETEEVNGTSEGNNNKRAAAEDGDDVGGDDNDDQNKDSIVGNKKSKQGRGEGEDGNDTSKLANDSCLVAKVNGTMRGHTAFLTVAERGFTATPLTSSSSSSSSSSSE
jgi:tRNA (adenine57-N1/adenine58-N1)-methyltransferase catalytic subunit